MDYNGASIIKDVNGKPVPQYWNEKTGIFEVIKSENGMLRSTLIDSKGVEIVSQDIVDQIDGKLSEILAVLKKDI